jgi:hypothetical protein
MAQQAVLWVAEHDLDAKPPTELHRTFQEARCSDPAFFLRNAYHISQVDRAEGIGPVSFPQRACF